MSLAFPLLISAVPIHKVDWSLRRNWEPAREWREWLKEQPDDWDPSASDPAVWPAPFPSEKPTAEVCWMSDGGISSNLPIHFFDAPLPRWPTFAMNLTEFHEDYPKQKEERFNSFMPQTYRQRILENFYPFSAEGGFKALCEFGESIVRTMQNRNFEALMRMPGFRDRIVHVALDSKEGGMNLGMRHDQIMPLAERGGEAAKKLVATYTREASGTDVSWDAHRWTRLRSMLVALEQLHVTTSKGLGAKVQPQGARSYSGLLLRGATDPPDSYRITGEDLVDLAEAELKAVEESAKRIRDSTRSLAEGGPQPPGTLRMVPPED